ncbi:phage tail tip lysozyme [Staphylococcus equorum]|uniref:Phage tail lysozyme domain-containing protein n=1 Tax=Staphylococcus equorum TaxID=246432 RepID=A0AAP7IFA6_9STAP|nr:phage tail tip lysozyme [Staphylococcus equorum]OEK58875.1 hypothetical protein ASS94_00710 [Staphylococcus equorum]
MTREVTIYTKLIITFLLIITSAFPLISPNETAQAVNSTAIDAQHGCVTNDSGEEKEDGEESKESDDGDKGNVTGKKKKNIKTMYKVLHEEHGFSGEMIAGIAGNWDAEGGIDPLATEGDSGNFSEENAKKASGDDSVGIGLGQWTFERHTLLVDYAKDKNDGKWWEMDVQMEFMLEKDSGAETLKSVGKDATDDPGENAITFHDEWERSADTNSMKQRRKESANEIWEFMKKEGMDGKKDTEKIDKVGGSSDSGEGESSASTNGDVEEISACGTEEDKGKDSGGGDGKVGESTKVNGKSGEVTEGSWTWDEMPKKYKKHVTIPEFDEEFLDKPGNNFPSTGNKGQCTELTWAYMNQLHKGKQPTDDGSVTDGYRVHEVYEKEGADTTDKPTVGYGFSSSSPYAGAAATPPGHTGLVAGVMDDGGFILVSYNLPPEPAPSREPIYSYVDGMPKDAGDDFVFFSGIEGKKGVKGGGDEKKEKDDK